MSESLILEVPEEAAGVRIDKFINENLPDLTRSAVQKLITGGNVLVGGARLRRFRYAVSD